MKKVPVAEIPSALLMQQRKRADFRELSITTENLPKPAQTLVTDFNDVMELKAHIRAG